MQSPTRHWSRRTFARRTGTAFLGAALAPFTSRPTHAAEVEKLDIAFMGLGVRGSFLLQEILASKTVHVSWLCDVDSRAVEAAGKTVAGQQTRAFKTTPDIRRVLEDRRVQAVVIAAPNHWHVPATLLALKAGKAVFVESPFSHTPREGELLLDSARRNRGVLHVGHPYRSLPWIREILQRVRTGEFGAVHLARAWYTDRQTGIGFGQLAPTPDGFDYDLWQGPAPLRPFRSNLLPAHWRRFWHWGGGDLVDQGVHLIDLARWGLGAECPIRVHSAGGRFHFEDDQETPDTQIVTFDFGLQTLVWEHRSCLPQPIDGETAGVAFHAENATVILSSSGFRILDPAGKQTQATPADSSPKSHIQAFLAAAAKRTPSDPASIEDACKSTLLCHLGNISHRVGRSLRMNPETRQVRDDREAASLWTREYRTGWQP